MARNTKHFGLLFAFVKLFLFYFFTSFLERWLRLGSGPGKRTQNAPWSPGGRQEQSSAPSRANFPERLCGVPRGRGAPGVLGFRIRRSPLPHCPHFREMPPHLQRHFSGSPPPHPGGRSSSPPPSSPGALNNDICMQGAIHKYVRASEI